MVLFNLASGYQCLQIRPAIFHLKKEEICDVETSFHVPFKVKYNYI